jgi:hypothetical protein
VARINSEKQKKALKNLIEESDIIIAPLKSVELQPTMIKKSRKTILKLSKPESQERIS